MLDGVVADTSVTTLSILISSSRSCKSSILSVSMVHCRPQRQDTSLPLADANTRNTTVYIKISQRSLTISTARCGYPFTSFTYWGVWRYWVCGDCSTLSCEEIQGSGARFNINMSYRYRKTISLWTWNRPFSTMKLPILVRWLLYRVTPLAFPIVLVILP